MKQIALSWKGRVLIGIKELMSNLSSKIKGK